MKPRVLFVGRSRYRLPLEAPVARKWEALATELDVRVLATGVSGPANDGMFHLVTDRRLGALPRERVLELFAAADAAVLSSAWENFPHTLVEALAVGTPVIATSVGGVPEIVTDGENGLLVPSGDPGALAAAVRRYFADDALRARFRAAAARSVERFSPEHVLDTLESVLERVAR